MSKSVHHRDNPMYVCPHCGGTMRVNRSVIGPTCVSRRHFCTSKGCRYKVVSLTVIATEAKQGRVPHGQGADGMLAKAESGEVEVRYVNKKGAPE